MTPDDWRSLRAEAETVFTPGTPIREQELFAGRAEEINKLDQRIRMAGSHAIIFGERGTGKSSLVNVFRYVVHSGPKKIQYVRVAATSNDNYNSIFEKLFKRIFIKDEKGSLHRLSDEYNGKTITPDDVLLEFEQFPENSIPVLVIDEFDRIEDQQTRILIADTVKLLSDESANVTVFVVGVADSVDELMSGHESIGRALAQIEMPRMKDQEVIDLITKRIFRIGMRINQEALWNCVFICKGLPYYAHLIGLHATQASCDRKSLQIQENDVASAIARAVSGTNQSIREGFEKAVYSERSDNIFIHVLASCALATKDPVGRFSAKSVAERLTAVTSETYDVPAFSYHLNGFCSGQRGGILEKIGERRQFKFRFKEALMEPYVLFEAINRGVITEKHIKMFRPKRQNDLFAT